MSDYVVQMKGIEKSYGKNEVLHGVDFLLEKGSIHALLGENGTGKTTLMNILTGIIPGNKGEIAVEGRIMHVNGSAVEQSSEIAFIHQEDVYKRQQKGRFHSGANNTAVSFLSFARVNRIFRHPHR